MCAFFRGEQDSSGTILRFCVHSKSNMADVLSDRSESEAAPRPRERGGRVGGSGGGGRRAAGGAAPPSGCPYFAASSASRRAASACGPSTLITHTRPTRARARERRERGQGLGARGGAVHAGSRTARGKKGRLCWLPLSCRAWRRRLAALRFGFGGTSDSGSLRKPNVGQSAQATCCHGPCPPHAIVPAEALSPAVWQCGVPTVSPLPSRAGKAHSSRGSASEKGL